MILGIIFPPAILLLDFRLGEEASNPSENQESGTKDEDNKSSKVRALGAAPPFCPLRPVMSTFVSGRRLQCGRDVKERR